MKEEKIDNKEAVASKFYQELVTFIMEDFVEVGLQFFYFEKYTYMPNDTLSYFNALFMTYKALEVTVLVIIWMKEEWKENDKESFW